MSTLMKFEQKNEPLIQERYLKLEIMEKIFDIMLSKGVKQVELAKKMKISKSQVSRLLTDDRNLTLASVSKIFAALGEELAIITKSEKAFLCEKSERTETVVHLNVSYEDMSSVIGKAMIPAARDGYSYSNLNYKK